jgi:aldehyde:ferredoxin oxidoreductase
MSWRLNMAEFGYAGEILKINLSDGEITKLPTADYADKFIGGRGFAVKLYWDLVPPEAKAYDPDNCFICVTGPAAGFKGIAGFRWQVCGKSALSEPEAFSYGNLGGSWGGLLKYAGYDALVVQGRSDKPVYIYINDNKVEIRDASRIWGKSVYETSDILKAEHGEKVSVMTTGQGGENLTSFATVFADEGASGSGGLGAVMGSKLLKAVAVTGSKSTKFANPEKLQSISKRLSRPAGAAAPPSPWSIPGISEPQICYGCEIGCTKEVYFDKNGRMLKSFCQATEVYQKQPKEYYGEGEKAMEMRLLGTKLADAYSLDTVAMQALIEWLVLCHKEGILNDENTSLPLSKIGTPEFIETLMRKIAFREGFGDTLARGIIEAAESFGEKAKELTTEVIATRASEKKDYDPRLFVTTALMYATEPRRPIHQLHEVSFGLFSWLGRRAEGRGPTFSSGDFRRMAKKFWGSEIAADFSTYEGKALATKKIQDRQMVKESMILCDFKFPNTIDMTSKDHTGDPTLESQVYSAITGKETSEEELYKVGERVINIQRAGRIRQGWGGREGDKLLDYLHTKPLTKDDIFFNPECIVPGKDGEVTSRLGMVVDRAEFEKMKSEYYELRGWDVESGLQTKAKLEELDLDDVAVDLGKRGLLK